MNPDEFRDAMNRKQMKYMKDSKITAHLDELSLKKQLLLHQQTNKPILRYKTAMTTYDFPNQGDSKTIPEFSVFGQNTKYDINYTGCIGVRPVLVKDGALSLPSYQIRLNQQNSKDNLFRLNPYIRPVSASDVAACVEGSRVKHVLVPSLAVSSLPEMSSVASLPQTLQRNSFLRPMSETSAREIRQASSNLRNSTYINKQMPSDAILLQQQNCFGSDLSVKSYFSKIAAAQNARKDTNASPFSITNHDISMESSKQLPVASHSSSLRVNKPSLQTTVQPLGNQQCTTAKSNIEPESFSIKQAGSHFDIPSQSFPCISPELTTSTNIKNTDQSLASASSLTGESENVSFGKMSGANTLGGLIYYNHLSEPRKNSILVSENTNSSNMAWQNVHNQTLGGSLSVSQLSRTLALPSFNSNSEKLKSSVQPNIRSSTQETRTDIIPQTNQNKVQMNERSEYNIKYNKAPANVNSVLGSMKTLVAVSSKNSKIPAQIPKLLPEDHSEVAVENKMPASQICIVSAVEQRSFGDGAPSAAKRLSETLQIKTSAIAINLDAESDDCNDEADDDAFNGSLGEDEEKERCNSTESCKGERLPGDGEANFEVVDDDYEELGNFEGDAGSEALDIPIKISHFESSHRPATADSTTHLHTQDDRLDKCMLKTSNRPATGTASDIIKPAFIFSLFVRIPPTLNFVIQGEKTEQLPVELSKQLRWKMSPITPTVVKSALARSGFRITRRNHDWLGCFGKHMKSNCFKSLQEYQKLNHFPGSFQIGRKDKLWRSLSKMQIHFGKQEFNFFPQTYILPSDIKLLKQAWEDNNTKQKWIIKPPASARGIGIRVISKWSQIPKRRPVIVQKYIHRPFLINASKFDMRIYVYVSCYDPLRLYVYEDGLARFASMRYSSSSKTLSNKYMHLTNYSVNKTNSNYLKNSDSTLCQGHKWSLKALWHYMKRQGVNTNLIWETIRDLIIKTIISGEAVINSITKSNTTSRYCCHELFGFDILLDEKFKPWILEVNISPSLNSNSQLDLSIKGAMIKDMMNIAGYRLPDETDVSSSRSSSDMGSQSPKNTFCIDKRLFTNQLALDERAKHSYYCQRYMDELINLTIIGESKTMWTSTLLKTSYLKMHLQAIASILNILTPDDIRLLCESIDEDARKGDFQRLFPTPSTHSYLRYFEKPRYYNLLLDQWVLHYNHKEQKGIQFLQSLCQKGLHLQNPTTDPQHQWNIPKISYAALRSSDSRIQQHTPRDSGHNASLHHNLKKLSLTAGQLSQSNSRNSQSTQNPSSSASSKSVS